MKKCLAISIFFLCVLFESDAQSGVAFVTQQFNAYQSAWPKTKLHLVFNQDKYAPGDTAYFKAWFLLEDLTAVPDKQLIEINLVDDQGQSKVHFIFPVNNGIGQNQLTLPDTLAAGIYLMTAHSNWMKNFDPAFIFKKEIRIVNENELRADEKPVFKAMAEGGHLIRDVSNKVIIRTHRPGSIIQVVDAAGQEIGQAISDIHGLASVTFTPGRNDSYFARFAGEAAQIPLPPVEEYGCSLLFTSDRTGTVKMVIASPPGSALRNEELIMVISAQGKIYYTVTATQGTKNFVAAEIPKTDFPEGIVHISILDRTGRLLASRDFYSAREHSIVAAIQAAKPVFETREKVSLEISLTDQNGQPIEGEFSISVLNAGIFGTQKRNSLSDELTIFSAIKEESMLIDRSEANWFSSLDNFMIYATEALPWKEIVEKEIPKPRFPFTSVIERSGRAYFSDTLEPIPDFALVMFYLQRKKMYYQTFAIDKGKISLALPDIFDQDEFFYLAHIAKGEEIQNVKIKWEDDSIALPHAPASKEVTHTDEYALFRDKKRLIDRSFSIYSSNPLATSMDTHPANDFEEEIAAADITIKVQDYVLLFTMQELIREVIPSLYSRKAGGKDIVRVSLPQPMEAINDPLYIIDGIATKNTPFFLSLKPSELLTVKVIFSPQKLMPLGLIGKNGIVIVQTRKGDMREPLDDATKRVEGLNRVIDFRTLDHSHDQDTHRPDFRSTVYWNPLVKTDSKGNATVEFFCSDDIGTFSIHVDGLTMGAMPFSANQDIEVVVGLKKN